MYLENMYPGLLWYKQEKVKERSPMEGRERGRGKNLITLNQKVHFQSTASRGELCLITLFLSFTLHREEELLLNV